MYAFYIDTKEVKAFMNCLLKTDSFDAFEVRNVSLTTLVDFSIDGIMNRDFLEEECDRIYCLWSELKPMIFDLIKGTKTPKQMKIVMALSKNRLPEIHENCKTAFLNIIYENDIVTFTTGSSQINFSLDKSHEACWNKYVEDFFKGIGIATNKIV